MADPTPSRRPAVRDRRDILAAAAAVILAALAWGTIPFTRPLPSLNDHELAQAEHLLHGLPAARLSGNMPMQDVSTGLLFGHAPPGLRGWAPALLWTGTLALVFTLGCLLHSPLCGGLAALLAASIISFGVTDMSCYAFTVLLAANVLAWSARAPGAWRGAAVGLALGLTLLQRSPLFLLPIVLAGQLWVERRGRDEPVRPAELAWICLLPLLLLLPWLRLNWFVEGRCLLFERGRADFNIITGALGAVSTQEGDVRSLVVLAGQTPLGWAAGAILGHPLSFLWACVRRLWFVLGLHPVLFLLASLSAWLGRGRPAVRTSALLAGYYAAIHCLMPVRPVYFEALWPVLAALAAWPAAAVLGRPSELGIGLCSRAVALAGALAGALGLYTVFVVLAYPGRAADAGRLRKLLAAHPSWACLQSEQGRVRLEQAESNAAIEPLRAAQRLDPGPSRELDLAWASLAAKGPAPNDLERLDLRAGTSEHMVRWQLLRMLDALQRGRAAQAQARFQEAQREWSGPFQPALRSTPQDRVLQTRLMSADAGAGGTLDELLRAWPLPRRLFLIERFQADVGKSVPEARNTARLLGAAERWLTLAAAAPRSQEDRIVEALRQTLQADMDEQQRRRFCDLCLRLEDGRAARSLLTQLARRRSRDARVALALATLTVRTGPRSEALKSIERLAALAREPELLCAAARLYWEMGESGRARPLFERFSRLRPESPEGALPLAILAVKAGPRAAALKRVERLEAVARTPDLSFAAATLYRDLHEPGRAQRLLQGIDPSASPDAELPLKLAGLAIDLGLPEEALRRLRPAAAPGAGAGQNLSAALLYERLGRNQEALAILDRLVRSHPGEARYLSDRGVVRALLGRRPEAVADLRRAIALDRRLLQSYLSLGALLCEMGQRDQALATYDAALAVASPRDADVAPMIRRAREGL